MVVQAVAPIGWRDRDAGVLGFTTSLGFSKKLERIERDPRAALAFHAREHGWASSSAFVLAQGRARIIAEPTQAQRDRIRDQAARYLGPQAEGPFWDRWLREYYSARVPVEVDADRIVVCPDLRCASGSPRVIGEPLPDREPEAQRPPKNGTGPRVDAARAGKRVRGTRHVLLGFAAGLPGAAEQDAAAAVQRAAGQARRASGAQGGGRYLRAAPTMEPWPSSSPPT